MGFLDKAKKLAEQAQTKLDEAQKQFSERRSTPPAEPPDAHAEPAPRRQESRTPPHGDPLGE